MTAKFVAIPYSPWSEKARWALDHHQVSYREETYLPYLGEVSLRWRIKRPLGRVSVPVFLDGETTLTDSFEIVRHADRVGGSAPLLDDHAATWNARSEAALAAGRVRCARALLGDPEAQTEALRGIVPKKHRKKMRFIARVAAKGLARKYPSGPPSDTRQALLDWREALGGRPTLGDTLSFSDIAMATVFEFVDPHPRVARGPATRRIWGDEHLAQEFADLVEWRDALYAAHRPANR